MSRNAEPPLMTTATFQESTCSNVRTWVEADSFLGVEQERERRRQTIEELNHRAALAAENQAALAELVGQDAHRFDQMEREVHGSAETTERVNEQLRDAAKEKVRFLPVAGGALGATLGGTVGACVFAVPGAAVGAAVGGAVGGAAGAAAKKVTYRHLRRAGSADVLGRPKYHAGLERSFSEQTVRTSGFRWKEEASRSWGGNHYEFGDVTRTLISRRSWKVKSGRRSGGEHYHFGDITRSAARVVFKRE
eukprot:CAMPEP_0171138830 /NCGR_PEP_ID=MMETSP0766_2-20121228/135763_1 /TAXON_ID=439317 /ORGANISM="Gambierdiscus australes, Strain CAWD 149" /LENGTH=249 /DNA_ID=CAMNT_0011602461 /DNA_START=21 /DNA_END=770 /DNA_ORIENTATION=-